MTSNKWTLSEEENQWRRTFCQIPLTAIYKHTDKGKQSLQVLASFFRLKAEIERKTSGQFQELLAHEITAFEEPGTGIRRALIEMKAYMEVTYRQQVGMAQVLDEQVAGPLESLKDASETYIQTLQDEILRTTQEYEVAATAHNEATSRLHYATMEAREAKERQRLALHEIGVPEFELQRLAARVAKTEEEQAQAVMARARAKTTLYNRIISRDEMTMAVSVAYQKAEEERLDQLHASLHRFLHVEKERLQLLQQTLTSFETQVQSLSRAEDMQLLIHNQRDPDNMHFQGKALALLDWQWSKTHADHVGNRRQHPSSLLEHRSSTENRSCASRTSSSTLPPTTRCFARYNTVINTDVLDSVASCDSPHAVFTQTPMSAALDECFARSQEEKTSLVNESIEREERVKLLRQSSSIDNDEVIVSPETSSNHYARTLAEAIVRETCKTAEGRALFVKYLNRQRSLETKVKDPASFDALVACFNAFLDECIRQDDIKAAKTAMILAETFYYPKKAQHHETQSESTNSDNLDSMQPRHTECTRSIDDESDNSIQRTSVLRADCRDYTKRTSEELLQYVDRVHPLLHGEGIGRGATRTYLQEKVKEHSIWKRPAFWEKALLLAIGEELQRTPQPCPWEELPSGGLKQNGLSSREEAVCHVHNIVFGQLGSFTLSMLEFDVPLAQIKSFVETMCDAHELTEDQRFLLRKNLQDIFATLR